MVRLLPNPQHHSPKICVCFEGSVCETWSEIFNNAKRLDNEDFAIVLTSNREIVMKLSEAVLQGLVDFIEKVCGNIHDATQSKARSYVSLDSQCRFWIL